MRSISIVLIGIALCTQAVARTVPAESRICAPSGSPPPEVDRFFTARAIKILHDARDGDNAALETSVAPDASFSFWRGDYGTDLAKSGLVGVRKIARFFEPIRFQVVSVDPGPIAYSAQVCEWTATVLFRTEKPEESFSVKFRFEKGLLKSADGNAVIVSEGDVR